MREKIIFFGDSIIKYNIKKKNYDWSQEFIKRINKNKKKNTISKHIHLPDLTQSKL